VNNYVDQPKLLVKGDHEGKAVQEIALRKWEVKGKIEWPVARIKIGQLFQNTGEKSLEIIYTFPFSSDQLLEKFDVYLNDQHVISKLVPAEQAGKEYEEFVTRGDFAIQLQSHRSNIFSLNIGNLSPGEMVRVEFQLCQLMEIQHGEVTLRVPTVVGPRYIPGIPIDAANGLGWAPPTAQVPDADFITPTFDFEGTSYTVSALFEITPSLVIKGIQSPSHPFQIKIDGETYWAIMGDELKADRDIVLKLQVNPPETNVAWKATYGDHPIVVLSLGVKDQRKSDHIPKDVVFLIDISGSMQGEKLTTTIKGVKLCLRKLNPEDRFQLIAFENNTHFWHGGGEWQPVTNNTLDLADRWLTCLESIGGTELYPALEAALNMPVESGRQRVIVLMTDGQVGNEASIVNLIQKYEHKDYMLLFGIDTAVNQHLFTSIQNCVPALCEYIFPGEDINRAVNIQFQMLDKLWIRRIELFEDGNKVTVRNTFPHFPLPIDSRTRPFLFLETYHPVNALDKIEIYFEDGLKKGIPVKLEQGMPLVENILVKFWAKKLIESFEVETLEESQNKLVDFLQKLAQDLQIQSRFTRWIAVKERENRPQEIANVQVVPVDFPYLWKQDYFMMKKASFDMACFVRDTQEYSKEYSETFEFFRDGKSKEKDIFDVFIQQKVDGHIELSGSQNPPSLDTLIVLLWIFRKIEEEKVDISGYENNLIKAIDFLRSHPSQFGHLESVLWEYFLWKFEETIQQCYPDFPIKVEMNKTVPPEALLKLEPRFKKLFSMESLPEGRKLNKFTNKLLKLLKAL